MWQYVATKEDRFEYSALTDVMGRNASNVATKLGCEKGNEWLCGLFAPEHQKMTLAQDIPL